MVSGAPSEPGIVPRHVVPAESRPAFVMPVTALRLPAESCGLSHLDRSVAEVSSRIDAFELPRLQIRSRRDALVLVPAEPCLTYNRLLDALDARIGRCCAAHAALTQLCPTRCDFEIPLSRPLKRGLADHLAEELAPVLDPYLSERPKVHALNLIAAAHWRSEVTLIEHYPLYSASKTSLPETFAVFGPDLFSDFGDRLAAPPEDFFED